MLLIITFERKRYIFPISFNYRLILKEIAAIMKAHPSGFVQAVTRFNVAPPAPLHPPPLKLRTS